MVKIKVTKNKTDHLLVQNELNSFKFQQFYFIFQGSCFLSIDIAVLLLFLVVSFFNDRSSSVKYDFIAIISPYSFDSRY